MTGLNRNLLRAAALIAGFAGGMLFFHLSPPWSCEREAPEIGTQLHQPIPPPEVPANWDATLGAPPVFTDITEKTGIRFRHENGLSGKYHYPEIMGGGIALLDYNGDGLLDIYFVNGNYLIKPPSPEIKNRLYRNNGDWTFTDVTEEAGVGDTGFGQGCCVADYDNDGDPDLYLSNYGPNVLYRNQGDGTFVNKAEEAGLLDPAWGQSSSFLDYNNDGLLDLYVQNYLTYSLDIDYEAFIYIGDEKFPDYPAPSNFKGAQDHLYRNNGDGTFTDVTKEAGLIAPEGKGMGIACYDMNQDGFVDIMVTNDGMENYLFRNRGNGTFEEVGLDAGVAFGGLGVPESSMGVDVGDFNADGFLDMIIPCTKKQVYTLYENHGEFFSDASMKTGLSQGTADRTGFNPNFLDYDNDGDLDLFFTTGGVRANELVPKDASYFKRYGNPNILMANNGSGRFIDVSSFAGSHFKTELIGRGSVTGDLDDDGDIDLVISNLAGPAHVLRNDTRGGHWITLLLKPVRGNNDAIGTIVEIQSAGRKQKAEVHGALTYLSQIDRRVHFGLGNATKIEMLKITWPDKTTQTLQNLPVDQHRLITQEH